MLKALDQRVARCTPDTRELVNFLTTAAENTGASVAAPTFESKGDSAFRSEARGRSCLGIDPELPIGISSLKPGPL